MLDGAPKDAGSYSVEVSVPETAKYSAVSSGKIPFAILPRPATLVITAVGDQSTESAEVSVTIVGALADIVRSGKALYAGISNYDGEHMIRAAEILEELHCPFVINQNRYSIFDRTIENNGLKAAVAREGKEKGLICFSPLAQGLLTNRYLNGIPEDSRIKKDGRFLKESALTEEKLAKIRGLNEIAESRGQSLAQMALAWLFKDNAVTSVIIGASRPAQILDNLGMMKNMSFTPEELAAIDALS